MIVRSMYGFAARVLMPTGMVLLAEYLLLGLLGLSEPPTHTHGILAIFGTIALGAGLISNVRSRRV